jgi:WD repeat-containing protein 59
LSNQLVIGSDEHQSCKQRCGACCVRTTIKDHIYTEAYGQCVLSRRGLFIIDLESPFEVPRFLPQGGTWDVADVQWNPHHSHAEYIVSTSSEKLYVFPSSPSFTDFTLCYRLIWNLRLPGKTSIQHILHAHYRAITDINWHTTEPDTVVSTGIDSWLWIWDLRETRKPSIGLSAFNCKKSDPRWNLTARLTECSQQVAPK